MTSAASISQRPFGTLPDGREVHAYTLDNGRGLALTAINLGGIVVALQCPDRAGDSANVVLGFAALANYVNRNLDLKSTDQKYMELLASGAECWIPGSINDELWRTA
jgi:aldose 1-epimerase